MESKKIDKNTLVLMNARFEIDRYYIKYGNRDNLRLAPIYRVYKKGLIYTFAAIWIQKLHLPFQSIWYADWKKDVKDFDDIIVFAGILNWNILKYLKRRNPTAKLRLWFWDSIDEKKKLSVIDKEICEIWSFDKADCKKYKFKENTQFYIKRNSFSNTQGVIYDAMFVGREKGRTAILNEIIEKLNSCNLKVYKYILDAKTANGMEYDEVLNIVEQSACIIDVPKPNQSGLTLRALEALFYSKKLITTDTTMRKRDFYHPNNILIWDSQSDIEIKKFFELPYISIAQEIKSKYTLEMWIDNFNK